MDARLASPRVQTIVWLGGGTLACIAVLSRWPLGAHDLTRPTLLLFGLVSIVASLIEIPTQLPRLGRDVQDLMACNEAALVLFLLMAPPGWAWFLLLGGYVATNVARHRSLLRNAFNLGTWSASVALAVFVFEAIAPATPGLTPRSALAAATAVTVHGIVNYAAVEAVVAASTGVSWRTRARATVALALLAAAGNTSLGLTMAALWQVDPWLTPVAAGVALLLRTAYRQVLVADELADDVRVERDRLQLVVSGTSDGTVLLDHASRVTVWSRTVEAWTGVDEADAVGRPVDEVLAPLVEAFEDGVPPALGAAVVTGRVVTEDRLWLRHRDGERRLVAVRHGLQRDRLDRVVADVVQLHDLTRQHEVERLKDDFLSRVSHELRTPLTAILGYARTLSAHRGRLAASATADMEERIVTRAEQLETLIADLLLVASVEAPEAVDAELADHDLLPLVQAAVDAERRRRPGREVVVRATGPTRADVHVTWVTTAVRYLVANALQYSPDDTPVEVVLAATAAGPTISVTDHGRGIPTSKLTEVFGRFTRVEDPLRMETGGAGVGLYVVDRLVRQLGGHVTVTSRLDEGSRFVVHLPPPASRPPVPEQPGDEAARPGAVPVGA